MSVFDPRAYWENRLEKAYGLHGVGYLGLGRHYNDWLYKVRRVVFLRRMRALGRDFREAAILDIGSGTGFYIERWLELGARKIVGIDLTEVAVSNLRGRYPDLRFHRLDITGDLQALGGEPFDVVSAFDVLFHVVEDAAYERALGQVAALLKPGGLFVWSENFLHGPTQRGVHHVSRSQAEIESILSASRLRVVERRPMFYLMNAPVDTESRFLKTFWARLTGLLERGELAGCAIGGLLYPLELALTRFAREGPGTEMMICEKIG
jgi:SAM-dependent methyltransferase